LPKWLIENIFDVLTDEEIKDFNAHVSEIIFFSSKNQISEDKNVNFDTFKLDINKKAIYIDLWGIFNESFFHWAGFLYKPLRRCIWSVLNNELIFSFSYLRMINLNQHNFFDEYSIKELSTIDPIILIHIKNDLNREIKSEFADFFTHIANEVVPSDLGILDTWWKEVVFNEEILKEMKGNLVIFPNKIKREHVLRLSGYEHDNTLSDLVDYCIIDMRMLYLIDHSLALFHDDKTYIMNEVKNIIIEFFKKYSIENELTKVIDQFGNIEYLLSHSTFERVKSACFQACFQVLKEKNLEFYNEFENFYRKCPLCQSEGQNHFHIQDIFFNRVYLDLKKQLIEVMKDKELDLELNRGDSFFGVPCLTCCKDVVLIKGKKSEVKIFEKFIQHYRKCPICSKENHVKYLSRFFHDNRYKELRDQLIEVLNNKNFSHYKFKVKIGVPCCKCFEKFFARHPIDCR